MGMSNPTNPARGHEPQGRRWRSCAFFVYDSEYGGGMIDMIDTWWGRAMANNYTSSASGTLHVSVAYAPQRDITAAVFHHAIARRYEDMADHTTKRSERRECLNAALHHYLEAYAEDSPDAK